MDNQPVSVNIMKGSKNDAIIWLVVAAKTGDDGKAKPEIKEFPTWDGVKNYIATLQY